MAINEESFRGVDLNLLVTFAVLFRERNVSRTAALLKVGQPAVSGSLARLRARFADPLFVRTGRGVRPTARAIEVAATLLPAMHTIECLITRGSGLARECAVSGDDGVN
ncbi:LysR family transcriptional regulator [Pseudomonas sp. TH08]|uniref:LysR family transcriptional regulator n=1 Tax=unclassified Pseudomonas TaxID=196821 RepID=UPI001914AD91|nr:MULTISPECIES: LysR family transcriptional regulator [unclassified Pseudomonas]MBK5530170.1 LysR family transcriptional regulator [Pseudomonas sp. TH06]MBK5535023.1 LysR family transcriptional regulator [Pseudomonas sp. TH08]